MDGQKNSALKIKNDSRECFLSTAAEQVSGTRDALGVRIARRAGRVNELSTWIGVTATRGTATEGTRELGTLDIGRLNKKFRSGLTPNPNPNPTPNSNPKT